MPKVYRVVDVETMGLRSIIGALRYAVYEVDEGLRRLVCLCETKENADRIADMLKDREGVRTVIEGVG